MIEKAVIKIRDEIEKNNNPYVQVVGEFLLKYLNNHPEAAEKIMAEDKTIMKSLDEMRKVAEKNRVGNCAVLTDEEGFKVVLKYFGIEENVNTSSIGQATKTKKQPDIDFDIKLEDLL